MTTSELGKEAHDVLKLKRDVEKEEEEEL